MTQRQSLVAIEERLEIEDVPVAVEVRQEDLTLTEAAASLRATIADDRREQIGLVAAGVNPHFFGGISERRRADRRDPCGGCSGGLGWFLRLS